MFKKKFFMEKIIIFSAYNTPRQPMSVLKKFQQNRSFRLAGYTQYILYIHECLVFYIDKNVSYSWPKGWTNGLEFFQETHGLDTRGVTQIKTIQIF